MSKFLIFVSHIVSSLCHNPSNCPQVCKLHATILYTMHSIHCNILCNGTSTVPGNTVQYNTVQYNIVHCNTVHCHTFFCDSVHCN